MKRTDRKTQIRKEKQNKLQDKKQKQKKIKERKRRRKDQKLRNGMGALREQTFLQVRGEAKK